MITKSHMWILGLMFLAGCSVNANDEKSNVSALSSHRVREIYFPNETVVYLLGFPTKADAMRVRKLGGSLTLEGRQDESLPEYRRKWKYFLGGQEVSVRISPFAIYTNRFGEQFTDLFGQKWKFVELKAEADVSWPVPKAPPSPYPSELVRLCGVAFFNHEDGKLYFVEEDSKGSNNKRLWVCTTFGLEF